MTRFKENGRMEEEAFIEAINELARVLKQTYGMTEFTVTRSPKSEMDEI